MPLSHPQGLILAATVACGCAVDASGLPGRSADGPLVDQGPAEPRDLGGEPGDLGPRDQGPPPDLFGCVPSAEICNGENDDCDRVIDEGVTINEPCDADRDGCMDGRTACLGGAPRCHGDGPEAAGAPCDGPDADDVAEGFWTCSDGGLICTNDCLATSEVCNRRDDDCDGAVDEDDACSDSADTCVPARRGDSVYLICREPPGRGDGWDEAWGECTRGGYALVQIDDEAERAFLVAVAGAEQWWVGGRTDRVDAPGRQDTATWTWRPSGATVAAGLWATGEPSGDGSCAHLAPGFGSLLDDIPCNRSFNYICEGTIVP